jgi:hypothetical protein
VLTPHKILYAISKRHKPGKEIFLTEVKTGPTWNNTNLRRIDAIAIKRSWASPCITAYEIKVDRQDFLRDEKWPEYLQFCHKFYFACPKGLIVPEELDPVVGLIWINPDNNALSIKKRAIFRNIEYPQSMFYHLVISHMHRDRHPFFSDTREYLAEWIEDKQERRQFASKVKSKMWAKMCAAEQENQKLKKEILRMERAIQEYQEIKQILAEHGVQIHYNLKRNLIDRLSHKLDSNLLSNLAIVQRMIGRILSDAQIAKDVPYES